MIKIVIRLAMGALWGLSGAVFAGEDFDRLLAQALVNHPSVEGRRAGLQAAQAEREGTEWQRYPTPSIEASTRDSGGNTGLFALEQPLWTGGRISAGIAAAGFREAAAAAAVVEAKQGVALRLISAYTDILRQQQRQDYAKTSATEHDKLLQMISRRVEKEVSPPADRDFARARLAQAATELSIANQGLQVAQGQLAQLVGHHVVAINDVKLDGRALPATQDEAMSRAIERSPVLARLEQTALASGEDVESKRAAVFPQLAVRLEKQTGTLPDERVMLVLRMQPGAGLSASSAIAAAQRRQDEARQAKEDATRTLREQVQTAFAEWRAAQVRLESTRLSAGMAQAVFDSYARQYVAGRKGWIDVLNAVREISQSQFALADAEALLRSSGLRLWLLTGEAPLGEVPAGTAR